MPTATPSVETVLTAVKAAIDAIASIGTVLTSDSPIEDDVEWLDVSNYISGGSMNLWVVELAGDEAFEGQAVGEFYSRYDVRIRYWSIRTNNASWSAEARAKVQSVVDALTGAASIFAISSQRQLHTPETVRIVSHGPREIRDVAQGGSQMVYETVLGLTVEARRWS